MTPPKSKTKETPFAKGVRVAHESRIAKYEAEVARINSVTSKYASNALKLAKIARGAWLELMELEKTAQAEADTEGPIFDTDWHPMDKALFTMNHVCAMAHDID